ncbi:MAG: hypothetical protein ACI9BF_000588 [Candidatus Paceibacteria bacterium]|jgi:hypothetical protein
MFAASAILFSTGILLRVSWVYILNSHKFSTKDKGKYIGRTASALVTAVFTSLYAQEVILLPLIFCGIIAFLYRDILVPVITEGVIFMYTLVALYVLIVTFDYHVIPNFINSLAIIFLISSLVVTFYYCVTKEKLSLNEQVAMMMVFLVVSVYIMLIGVIIQFDSNSTFLGQILVGFYSLNLMSYVVYLLYFIPLRLSVKQSVEDRESDIAGHSSFLEKKYIDVNTSVPVIFLIVALVGSLFVIDGFFTDTITPVLMVMIFGTVILQPSEYLMMKD